MRKTFQVPGIAVAVVKDGEIVFERGWGERELGKASVDAHTLFAIASNTKAFTATALYLLAKESASGMKDRITDHLPWFQMADPYITREMRVRALKSPYPGHIGKITLRAPKTPPRARAHRTRETMSPHSQYRQ